MAFSLLNQFFARFRLDLKGAHFGRKMKYIRIYE